MNHDEKIMQCETRKVLGCNVRVFFTEKDYNNFIWENQQVECYIVSNLYEAFERRNKLCGGCIN